MSEQTFILGKDAALEDSIHKFQQNSPHLVSILKKRLGSILYRMYGQYIFVIKIAHNVLLMVKVRRKSGACLCIREYFERLSTNYFFADFYLGQDIANSDFVHYPNEKWFPIEDENLLPNGLLNQELLDYYDPQQELTPQLLVDLQSSHYDRGIVAMPYVRQSDQTTVYIPQSIIANLYVSNGMSAGNSKFEARVQGLSEVFERHIKNKIIAEAISLPLIPAEVMARFPTIQAAIAKLEQEGFLF